MYDANGDKVNPRDHLNAEELAAFYANRDRGPRRTYKAPRARRFEDPVVSETAEQDEAWVARRLGWLGDPS